MATAKCNDCLKSFVFTKEPDSRGNISLSVKNKDDILLAVRNAYKDMSVRTIKGLGQINKKSKNNLNADVDGLLKSLANKYHDLFNNNILFLTGKSNTDFEKWHNDVCILFKNNYNTILKNNGVSYNGSIQTIKYGKAQKIINMTFKYIYCFDDVTNDMFVYCHMPIDSNILSWYAKEYNGNNKIQNNSWSNLDEKEYMNLQDQISGMLINASVTNKNGNTIALPKNRLEAEMIIWPIYRH